MKNLKKIFAVAMSIATVAMSTSAFAATYDAEATSVALTADEIATLDSYAGQMTVVVVPTTFGEASGAADIYYINQDEAGEAFDAILADMGVKAALGEENEWEVRVGGTNVEEVKTFAIAIDDGGDVTMKYAYGDVNGDEMQDTSDALEILYYEAWMESLLDDEDPDRLKAADINKDEAYDTSDALEILYYEAWLPSLLDDLLAE